MCERITWRVGRKEREISWRQAVGLQSGRRAAWSASDRAAMREASGWQCIGQDVKARVGLDKDILLSVED